MMSRTVWIALAAAGAALVLGVGGTLLWVESRDSRTAEGQPPATASVTITGTPAPGAPSGEPTSVSPSGSSPEPATGVAVTAETGESYCYVRDAFSQDGRRYVVLDYIELGADLGMSEDYEIINNNPRLRTFEITGDSYIGAFWMAVELYGESKAEEWDDYSAEGDWLGVPLAWEDLVAAVDEGTANDYSYWFVWVDAGRVVRLINTYQD